MRTYVVQAGDTLGRIASIFGTTVDRLVQLNGIANPDSACELMLPELKNSLSHNKGLGFTVGTLAESVPEPLQEP